MSRMLAYVAPRPLDPSTALGPDLMTAFAQLSRVHADGWGVAWRDSDGVAAHTASTRLPSPTELAEALPPSSAALIYLRFGSAGTRTGSAEAQPFVRAGRALQHNGALRPATRLRDQLTETERAGLRGTNDSELYFARVSRELADPIDPAAVIDGVLAVRELYADACLNALLLSPDALIVVHSSGGRGAPLAAFANRGLDLDTLPSGHDDDYNRLYTRVTANGVRAVATTGIPLDGWTPLPDDTVSVVTPFAVASVPLVQA